MKDIDLFPQWYKSGRAKKRTLRSQYMVLGAVAVIMLVWNFMAVHSLSTALAQLNSEGKKYAQAQAIIKQSNETAAKIEKLRKRAELLEQVDSRIDIADVLSELSFLIDGRIVLSDVSFETEKIETGRPNETSASGVRVAGSSSSKASQGLGGDVRFKGKVRGIAVETGDVGKLVGKLEESQYFRDVSLAFSRSRQIKISSSDTNEQRQVSEFEISFYLANYRIESSRTNQKGG